MVLGGGKAVTLGWLGGQWGWRPTWGSHCFNPNGMGEGRWELKGLGFRGLAKLASLP